MSEYHESMHEWCVQVTTQLCVTFVSVIDVSVKFGVIGNFSFFTI